MDIYYEESFGPVVSVIRASGDEALLAIANDTEYGLASAVYSQDISRAMGVALRIQAGICHINGATVADEAQMPFGGVKGSGYGRFGGRFGVAEFTDVKWLSIELAPHYPF
jgi:benzaldehyde dehydrogenase (NAD)